MSDATNSGTSRRQFLKNTGTIAAATTLVGAAVPKVHAAEDNTIRVALVGCGGRGGGAAANALSVKNGPIKLVALADVFDERVKNAHSNLSNGFGDKVDVPEDQRFVGFDAYRKAIDCLRPGDVAIFATPPAFRWVHFTYAIEKGVNVFMEKPVTVDGPATRKMLKLAEESKKKDLKVAVGLMCRHCKARAELFDRIKSGEIGDITALRAYRVTGPTGSAFTPAMPASWQHGELLYQIRNFHAFLWASGGAVSDFLIHNIDECCWMKDDWPVEAKGYGGRQYRGNYVDQNFDVYSVEYTFPDGAKLLLHGRGMGGCDNEFASYAHGTKGSAVISTSAHSPAKCRIYEGQHLGVDDKLKWAFPQPEQNPYQLEWNDLIDAIRQNKPYNEVERGAMASLVTSMGRLAAHSGKTITRDEMLAHEHEFAPNVDKLTLDSPAPLKSGSNGEYPIPQPGLLGKREYKEFA